MMTIDSKIEEKFTKISSLLAKMCPEEGGVNQQEVGEGSKIAGKRKVREGRSNPGFNREVQIATLGPVAFYPLPSQQGAPYFNGTDVSDFIAKWEILASEWTEEQKIRRIV